MIEVEYIFPYTIVKENDLYGIVDRTGNFVVPCVMDKIVNDKNEEIGLSTWDDFFCVIIVKDGKYGFYTNNGDCSTELNALKSFEKGNLSRCFNKIEPK